MNQVTVRSTTEYGGEERKMVLTVGEGGKTTERETEATRADSICEPWQWEKGVKIAVNRNTCPDL